MAMFNRFTERARKVILLAKEEAKRFNHDYIGTEHILLGLVREGEGVAAAVLASFGLTSDKIRIEVEKLVQPGPSTVISGDLPFTPKAKKVMELATEEARALGHNYIGTEHLLLGLIREGEGVASQVLMNLGLELERVREEVMNLLGSAIPGYEMGQKVSHAKTPALDAFGRDLTKLAKDNKLDPVIGRKNEIERVIQILSRRTKNNPVLLGEAGVGKTAIVEGLAQKIVTGDIPEILKDQRIIILDLALMVAGTKYRGQFEERIKAVMDEIKRSEDIIIFIDELHTLIGAGGAEGAIDASNILKPALSRGEIQCIGATTLDEFRKHIEKDAALERRFQTIMVEPPTVDETIEILKGLRDKYEAHHRVKFTDAAVEAAAKLSDRYITGRYLPDKAKERKGKLMLINASSEFEKGKPKNFIPDDKIIKIARAVHDWKDIDKFTKIITNEEASKNDYNLSPSRYVGNNEEEEYQDVAEILVELAELEEDRLKTDKELNSIMKKIGYKGFLG